MGRPCSVTASGSPLASNWRNSSRAWALNWDLETWRGDPVAIKGNVSGSVSAAPTTINAGSSFGNELDPSFALISQGNITASTGAVWNLINGPSNFGSGGAISFTSHTGTAINLLGFVDELAIDNYTLGAPIVGSGLLAGQTLTSLGFSSTTPGLLASWTIAGSSGETVEVRIGSNAPSSVPGPLPLLGAAAGFAHSRRLRARLRTGSSSPLT